MSVSSPASPTIQQMCSVVYVVQWGNGNIYFMAVYVVWGIHTIHYKNLTMYCCSLQEKGTMETFFDEFTHLGDLHKCNAI